MKQKLLTKLLLMLLCIVGGASFSPAWATVVTYKLTIDHNKFVTTSYESNNNEKTSYAVCTTDNTKTYEVKWTSYQVMKNSTNMQWQKSKGYIYNSTDLGTITDVTVTSSGGSFTTYYGTSEKPSSGSAGSGKGFFKTSVGSATGYTSKVEITFQIDETPTSTAPTIDDGEASSNFTISKDVTITAADGATIYYTTDGTDPTTSSSSYSSFIHITSTTTIKAAALEDGKALSSVSSKTFTKVLADNTITVTGGTTPSVDRTGGSAVDDWTPTVSATSDGTITYAIKSTSNLTQGTDFTFNTTTGKVSFLTAYKGEIVITASVAADADYAAASEDITLTVNGNKRTPVIAYDGEDTEISTGGTLVIDPELIETDGAITVTSSNSSVASVSTYSITGEADGTVTITVSTAEGTYYSAGSGTFSLEVVTPSACDIALTGAPISKTFDVYSNAHSQVITYTTSSTGTVSIAASSYAIFDVDQENKKITITPKSKTPSAQTITINQAAAGRYLAGSTTFSLTVTNSATSETYEKVTDAATLTVGDELIIVNETYSEAGGAISKSLITPVGVTISDSKINLSSSTSVVTYRLGGSSGSWTLQNVSNNYFLQSTSAKSMAESATSTMTWAISISNGDATITASGASVGNLQYNRNNGNPRFTTYTSSQSAPQLYRRAKYPNTITVTDGTAQTLELESKTDLTLSATSYCGAVSFAFKSATNLTKDTDFTFDAATGELHVNEDAVSGTITITASTVESATHKAASSDIVITVVGKPADPDFSEITDQEIVAGSTYTLVNGEQFTTDGTVTLTTGNSSIASVSGLIVTAVAVGTTTIRVSAAKGSLYNAGSTTFDITVTAPTGKTEVSDIVLFNESFSKTSGPYEEDSFSGSSSYSITADETYWTFTNGNGGDGCAKFGSSSNTGSAVTRSLTVTSGKSYKLSFKCAPWDTGTDGVKVTVTGGTIDGKSSATTGALTSGKWNTKDYTIIATSTTMSLTFEKGGSENRFFLDDIVLSYTPTAAVTLNTSGYATYCSVNPMDFSSTEGYTVWRISNIAADGTITFNKITEAIKGGQGVLLFNKDADGVNTSNVTVNFADGSTEFTSSENMLIGTTAPTYVAAETAYGLSNAKFVKNSAAGNIPAGKAYINASSIPAGVKTFTFVFEDEADGIRTIENVSVEEAAQIFDLLGRRLNKMQKGINIVNGKKILK